MFIANNHILYEDNHLLIVNKKAGLLCQGDKSGDRSLLDFYKAYLKETYQKKGNVFLGLPHRLDRPVSGVLLMTKTSKALTRISKQFRDQVVNKIYLAVTHSMPSRPEGTLIDWIKKDPSKNKVMVRKNAAEQFKRAELFYRLLAVHNRYHLLEVVPKTGRPHQIRAQLTAIGCPIWGDVKYGSTNKVADGHIYLHALQLEFEHPVKKELLKIPAPLPKDPVWNLFNNHT